MVFLTFENFHDFSPQFIFQLQYHSLGKVTISLFQNLKAEKMLAPSMECIRQDFGSENEVSSLWVPPGTQKMG